VTRFVVKTGDRELGTLDLVEGARLLDIVQGMRFGRILFVEEDPPEPNPPADKPLRPKRKKAG
jgi:hypothetical protein